LRFAAAVDVTRATKKWTTKTRHVDSKEVFVAVVVAVVVEPSTDGVLVVVDVDVVWLVVVAVLAGVAAGADGALARLAELEATEAAEVFFVVVVAAVVFVDCVA